MIFWWCCGPVVVEFAMYAENVNYAVSSCWSEFICVTDADVDSLLNRLESAVLDLNADDTEGLHKQKSSYHWDKVLVNKIRGICTQDWNTHLHFDF